MKLLIVFMLIMLITNENIELKQCLDCKTKLKNITEHIFSLCVKKSTILDCIEKQNKDIFYLYGKEATLMEKENIKNILNNCSKCIINNTKKDKNYSFEKDLLNEDKDLNLYETFIQKNEISNIIKKEQEFKLKEKNLKEQLEKEIKIKESALEKVKEVKKFISNKEKSTDINKLVRSNLIEKIRNTTKKLYLKYNELMNEVIYLSLLSNTLDLLFNKNNLACNKILGNESYQVKKIKEIISKNLFISPFTIQKVCVAKEVLLIYNQYNKAKIQLDQSISKNEYDLIKNNIKTIGNLFNESKDLMKMIKLDIDLKTKSFLPISTNFKFSFKQNNISDEEKQKFYNMEPPVVLIDDETKKKQLYYNYITPTIVKKLDGKNYFEEEWTSNISNYRSNNNKIINKRNGPVEFILNETSENNYTNHPSHKEEEKYSFYSLKPLEEVEYRHLTSDTVRNDNKITKEVPHAAFSNNQRTNVLEIKESPHLQHNIDFIDTEVENMFSKWKQLLKSSKNEKENNINIQTKSTSDIPKNKISDSSVISEKQSDQIDSEYSLIQVKEANIVLDNVLDKILDLYKRKQKLIKL